MLINTKGLDPEICNERLQKYKIKRTEERAKLDELTRNQPKAIWIDPGKARDYFENFKTIYELGTNEQKRQLFKTYIKRMELDPENMRVNVVFYASYNYIHPLMCLACLI